MPTGPIDPFSQPQAWDVIQVAQQVSPGLCKLAGFKRAFEWDQKKGKGTTGATATFVGRPLAKGTITIKIWTLDQYNALIAFLPLLKYDPTKKAVQAVDVYHPALAMIDLLSFVCEGVGMLEHAGEQLYTCVIELLEYAPPPKASAVSTPSGSATTGTGGSGASGTPADPVADAQQKEIAALLNKASQP